MARNIDETDDPQATDRHTEATDRRTVLKYAGVTGLAGIGSLAGCVGVDDGGSTDTPTSSGGGDADGDTDTDTDTATETGPESITLGQPAAITGRWDFLQPAVSQSTDLAIQEINDAGGILGAEVSVSRRDTAVSPQEARTVVNQLVNNDEVPAMIGLFSSEITPLFDFLQETAVPVVTPWPGATSLDTRGGDKGTETLDDDGWVWRTVIGDTVGTLGAAQYVLEQDISTMGIMNLTSQGERSWAESFRQAYEGNGGTVTQVVEVSEGRASYQSELNTLFEADFDAWALAVGLQDATTIIREWDSAGYGRQLLLEDGLRDPDLIENVGEQANGAWIAAGSSEGPNYDTFVEKFQSAGDADVHTWGVAAYDAVNVTALAAERGGSADPETIQQNLGPVAREGGTTVSTFAEGKEALANGDEINYDGAATPVDFTDFGNVFGDVTISSVTPDGFEIEDTVPADDLQGLIEDY